VSFNSRWTWTYPSASVPCFLPTFLSNLMLEQTVLLVLMTLVSREEIVALVVVLVLLLIRLRESRLEPSRSGRVALGGRHGG
jgi:hypothetical protein